MRSGSIELFIASHVGTDDGEFAWSLGVANDSRDPDRYLMFQRGKEAASNQDRALGHDQLYCELMLDRVRAFYGGIESIYLSRHFIDLTLTEKKAEQERLPISIRVRLEIPEAEWSRLKIELGRITDSMVPLVLL